MKKIIIIVLVLTYIVSVTNAQSSMKISEVEGTIIFKDLITAIYTELGYDTEFFFLPVERGLVSVNSGIYDADMARVQGVIANYPNLMETSEPITEGHLQIWTKNGSELFITNPEDMKNYKIGIIIGMKRTENLVEKFAIQATRVAKMKTLHMMLLTNRIDAALVPDTAITPDFREGLYAANPELVSFHGFHILNKKHAALAPKFDAVLKAMKTDGRYQKLMSGETE